MKKGRKNFWLLGLIVFAIFGWAGSSEAKTLYVDGSVGNDSVTYANNSSLIPWRTLGRALWGNANKSTPNSSEAAVAGDTVLVAMGTYSYAGSDRRYEPAFNPVNSGTPGNPIVFKASGVVHLTLSSGTGPVFGANSKNYITWDGFITDENDHNVYDGEPTLGAAWGSNYIIFQNSTFIGKNLPEDGRNHSAIRFEGSTNSRVYNNVFRGFTGTGENHADVYLYSSDDILVEHNEHRDGNGAVWAKGGASNDRFIFRYNLVYNMAGFGARLGPISRDGRVYQNVIYNSLAGLRNDSWLGIEGSDNIFANNTVVNSTLIGMHMHCNDYPSAFYNNIVADISGDSGFGGATGSWCTDTPGANIFEHNLYYGLLSTDQFWYTQGTPDRRSFAYWQGTWGKDSVSPVGRIADPLFVNKAARNYRLQSGSPALTLGVDILDLDNDGQTNDTVPAGAYITGNEVIGIVTSSDTTSDTTPPAAPTGLSVN